MDEDTVGSSFMIPVHLLDDLGYFRRSRRFWTEEPFSEGPATARRIAAQIERMGLTDTESQKALRRLRWAEQEDEWRFAGWILTIVAVVVAGGYAAWRYRRRVAALQLRH
jgi:hypothetical protein